MRLRSLKAGMFVAVASVVIGSGMAISQLAVHRYSTSLLNEATARAERVAHKLSMDAADKILINDLVALHKLINDQILIDPAVSYVFIVRDGKIVVHTFSDGFPVELISANLPVNDEKSRLTKIVSERGEHFLDIAWPIFSGKAGVLRLGMSEKPYQAKIRGLWLQMSLFTLGIMILAILVGKHLISRLTRPLMMLTHAAEQIDEGHLEVQTNVHGYNEVAKLAFSFNGMLARIREYTDRLNASNRLLEQKNRELDRSHRQLTTSYTISQQIAALSDLNEISTYLIRTLNTVVECQEMLFALFGQSRQHLFIAYKNRIQIAGKESHDRFSEWFGDRSFSTFIEKENLTVVSKWMPQQFTDASKLAVFPIRYNHQALGIMLIACPGKCQCVKKELDIIHIILGQASGALFRAILHEEEAWDLRARMEMTSEFSNIIGKDQKMQIIYKLIEDVAPTDATVLIEGESGTGKELVARAVHNLSHRSEEPFIVINCAAYPSTLIESELFGHEKGAFTGAVKRKLGRFELADGGTVFLDEIGEISPSVQIKLLRILQTQKFERIGGEESIKVNVRILAATNKNLLQEVQKGGFREDLYYRLNVIPVRIPPLRDRRNDIPLLAQHFLERFSIKDGKKIKGFDSEGMRLLLDYGWPGNVRELENSIEHAVILAKGDTIAVSDLPSILIRKKESPPISNKREIGFQEEHLIREVLIECNGNKRQAAERLGISRSTLYEKMKKYRIEKPVIH